MSSTRADGDRRDRRSTAGAEDIDTLDILHHLARGFEHYLGCLLRAEDDVLAVAGAVRLLDAGAATEAHYDRFVALAKYDAVVLRAADHFLGAFEHRRVRELMAASPSRTRYPARAGVQAAYFDDARLRTKVEIENFFRDGNATHVESAAQFALQAGGWKEGLPHLIRCILINPQDVRHFVRLGRTLRGANQYELLRRLCDVVERIDIFPNSARMFRADVLSHGGQHRAAIACLQGADFARFTPDLRIDAYNRLAHFYEMAGDDPEALAALLEQKAAQRDASVDPREFEEAVKRRKRFPVPVGREDGRRDHLILTGFPRSGTTLLEHALDSHPKIETFEEIPAFLAVERLIDKEAARPAPSPDFVEMARNVYYWEIDRRKRKPEAVAFIDKMPTLAAEADLLSRIFSGKRYLFSLRHPYDVVISCFKQYFMKNSATSAFQTFENACRVYDFAMTEWFAAHSLQASDVCYVRYERLVVDFESELARALEFIGVGWSDRLRAFPKTAESRLAFTPGHEKIVAGLAIGVQSSWKHYAALFRRPEAMVLQKWLDFFDYRDA